MLELWDVYTGSFMYNNVATFAHLGGFFCGLLLIFPLWIRLENKFGMKQEANLQIQRKQVIIDRLKSPLFESDNYSWVLIEIQGNYTHDLV